MYLFEPVFQFMHNGIGHLLGAWSKLQDGDEFGFGFAGDPDPDILIRLFDLGPELIELQMRQLQIGKKALMQLLPMGATAGQPGSDSQLPDAEDFFNGGRV
ncbi:MAG: hypothetical protein NTZ74_02415 [Chloroflexi bacterium]|nr:hypothetical protein [Chloroflexota bacterium]